MTAITCKTIQGRSVQFVAARERDADGVPWAKQQNLLSKFEPMEGFKSLDDVFVAKCKYLDLSKQEHLGFVVKTPEEILLFKDLGADPEAPKPAVKLNVDMGSSPIPTPAKKGPFGRPLRVETDEPTPPKAA